MLRRFTPAVATAAFPLAATGKRFAATTAAAPAASASAVATNKANASELVGPTVQALDQLAGYYVNIQSRKMYYKDFLRIEHQAVRWAFADIRKNSEALAHGLLQTGVRPGNRILCIQPCNCETLVLQLAAAKIGALLCVMPHIGVTADKLRFYLNEFQPSHLIGREWIMVPDKKPNGETVERNMHFWDMIYNVIPELGLSYPGQKFQWVHSQEFFFLKKCIITDHNMNLMCTTPMRKLTVWGPFSFYEQRLRRLSLLLHPDDPILCLEDPKPSVEDKPHLCFTHRNCNNAGYIFGELMKLKAENRFAVMPNYHTSPIGAIVAPYAALTSGAVLVHIHDNLFTDDHAINAIEKLCVEEVCGILGKLGDFEFLLKHAGNFDMDQYEHLKWVAIFEDGIDAPATNDELQKIYEALGLEEIYVFSGPMEACHMLTMKSYKAGTTSVIPNVDFKIVGDRGTTDAKILSKGMRGNVKIKAPHATPFYFNNAGYMTELLDDKGFVSTSREGIINDENLQILPTQTY